MNGRHRPSSQALANASTTPSPSPRTPASLPCQQATPSTPGAASTSSASTITANYNYYAALVSPIHQRFIDLETRLKRWRIFRHFHASSTANRRSTSAEPERRSRVRKADDEQEGEQQIRLNKSNPAFGVDECGSSVGSATCPVPRKKLQMNLSGPPRPRPKLDPVSSSSDSLSPEEVSQRFQIIQEKSGQLNLNGTIFNGVEFQHLERLEQNAQLGDGAGGSVAKYKLKSRPIAVKQMKRTDSVDESKRIFMDLDVLSKCNDCPYIVKYYGYIITFDFVYICMEVMATCLEKLLSDRQKSRPLEKVGLPEEIIGKIALSVVRALDYLKEKHKIMHRDVKPSNILLDWYGNVKLCDFGISAMTKTGCTGYLAPERINFESAGAMAYDVRADVWSLGITLVELAIGRFPYRYSTPFELMLKIKNDEPPVLIHELDGFSEEFCQFVADCLQKDMAIRPKFKDLLEKPFLQRAACSDVDVGLWFSSPEEYEALYGRS